MKKQNCSQSCAGTVYKYIHKKRFCQLEQSKTELLYISSSFVMDSPPESIRYSLDYIYRTDKKVEKILDMCPSIKRYHCTIRPNNRYHSIKLKLYQLISHTSNGRCRPRVEQRLGVHGPVAITTFLVLKLPLLVTTVTISPGIISITL